MMILTLLLLLFAFGCFVASAFSYPKRFFLLGLGLAAWVLIPLIHAFRAL